MLRAGPASAGGLPGRTSIKVGNIMRSRRNQGQRLLARSHQRNLYQRRLSMPSATVRHHARLWEENG